ncbi:MAG: B12-binding domain-containing radical SAM protein [Phycisphaerales bacterium]|nr:radical SAM protein [Planctomycetota bacterium]MCH8508494.1 B12-binding domain-containing radical SAM protein [Phycisphaerales bacterium]
MIHDIGGRANTDSRVTAGEDALLRRPGRRVAIVDLNNFATFPTLAVGLLVASLRNAGFEAEVICPLAHDVPAFERERRERVTDHWQRRIRLSTRPSVTTVREASRRARRWWSERPHPRVLREAERVLDTGPDAMLLSAYLQHYRTVYELGRLAGDRGVPLILGGPAFNQRLTAEAWRSIPGLTAIVGGEVDLDLPDIVSAAIDGADLMAFAGITLPDGRRSPEAAPLRNLDRIPVPDFSDFPWDRYRMRVLPIMAGRGCQWNKCTFCSDIVSASGRTFRVRSIDAIMHEIRELSRRHESSNFVFLDLKLNSDPATWRGIIERIQENAPGAQWIGTVHVDQRKDNGLTRKDLRSAVAAGMRRVSFGLESGSQRMLDAMKKGCTVEANSEFVRQAYEAGLSVRCTMFKGYPGETAGDLEQTADFLEKHMEYIDRLRFNEFAVLEGTPVFEGMSQDPPRFPELKIIYPDRRNAIARHVNTETTGAAYRKAKARVLAATYEINRRPVRRSARAFDGLM